MDRNLFLAVGLSVLIYMGWFKFIEKRYPVAQPRAVPAASQPGAPSGPNAAPNGEPPIAVTVGGVALAVQPMGAGLASFQYPDASKTVDLVYSRGSALLSTFPELKFRQVGGAAFEAELPSGVKVLKEFRIDGPD
ncbi:MAG TPA: hypothetical protein VNI01_00895, partial [Elusimicrobiota bacterium]|nr:hypothetical protein [Elusimicrobiota bacterium]